MLAEKQVLSLEELEAQTAIELPERELMQTQAGLVNLFIGNLVVVVPISVAANVCGLQVAALSALLVQQQKVTCTAASTATGLGAGVIAVESRH
jgi:hypothetical protein